MNFITWGNIFIEIKKGIIADEIFYVINSFSLLKSIDEIERAM